MDPACALPCPSNEESLPDSDEYDTDLEITEPDPAAPPVKEKTVMKSHDRYARSCNRLGVPTQSTVIHNMDRTELNLRHRSLGPTAIRALSAALKKNMTIDVLDLADNNVETAGKYIAEALAKNQCATQVDLSNNSLDTVGAWALSEVLKNNRTIRKLHLSGNNFREEAALYIAIGIQSNSTVKHLDISHNSFSENGGVLIGKALAENFCMTTLNISWNHIRGKGAVGICKGLQENTTLRELDISWNGLAYEGALSVSRLLKCNTPLCTLDISNNKINWQGALLIADGLRNNNTLQTLLVGHNPLTTTGCMDIIEAVSADNCGLVNLDVSGVLVIGEFELMSMAIKQTRDFNYKHGGIVNSHDILGQRSGRRIEPMQRVINYMKERELRPTELFRSFDKEVSNRLDNQQLVERIKKCGLDLPKHEIEELLEYIETRGIVKGSSQKGAINYKTMIQSVHDQIDRERAVKIRERERQKKIVRYHKDILSVQLPSINPADGGVAPPLTRPLHRSTSEISRISLVEAGSSFPASSNRTMSSQLPGAASKKPTIMSMSTQLGGKAKAFGTAGIKKRKKKRKCKRK